MSSLPERTRPVSLWSIIESLQRRLERQGLSSEVVDCAVVSALATAVRHGPRGS
jgi:hypothetical protein